MTILNCGGNAGGSGLPDPTSASAGDVLTLDSNKDAVWQAPSGGGGVTAHKYTTYGEMITDMTNHVDGILRLNADLVTFDGGNPSDKNLANPSYMIYSSNSAYITFGTTLGVGTTTLYLRTASQIALSKTSTDTSKTVDLLSYYLGSSYNPPTGVKEGTATIPINAFTLYY